VVSLDINISSLIPRGPHSSPFSECSLRLLPFAELMVGSEWQTVGNRAFSAIQLILPVLTLSCI
jgi:hypothetical protein